MGFPTGHSQALSHIQSLENNSYLSNQKKISDTQLHTISSNKLN